MLQVFLEDRGPFELDPYFTEAREELTKLARETALLPDTPASQPRGVGYLIAALSHWQTNKWDTQSAINNTKDDDTLLETVFSFLPDHLMIIINGGDFILNCDSYKIHFLVENDGFTLIADQFEYFKKGEGKMIAGRRKVTRKYSIHMPYDWNMMQGSLSCDGTICLKIPRLQPSCS